MAFLFHRMARFIALWWRTSARSPRQNRSSSTRLRALRNKNLADIDNLIAAEKEFDRGFCGRYYREHLRFSFGEREKKGLRTFQELCQKHDLLPKRDIAFSVV